MEKTLSNAAPTYEEASLQLHRALKGKLEITSRISIQDEESLALVYTPGVAAPCLAIQEDENKSYELTRRGNTIAVVTDGTAVLGLGDIGPVAGMPVMEGKCVLFKEFGEIDAIPLCINSKSIEEIVQTISLLSGSFGGINLEDISSPRCFEIEKRLQELCDIPVFHDDQHGTAIVVCAALWNACKLVKKDITELKVVQNGPGAAGTAILYMLKELGVKDIIAVDEYGILIENRKDGLTSHKKALARETNPRGVTGTLTEALQGADVFIGTSVAGCLSTDMIKSMNSQAIIFACANPIPEIYPEEAYKAGASIVCTGRSDYPNQVNNVLVFPSLFRGALDANATCITSNMKLAAVYALAAVVKDELSPSYILPKPFDPRIKKAVSQAVAEAAIQDGVQRVSSCSEDFKG